MAFASTQPIKVPAAIPKVAAFKTWRSFRAAEDGEQGPRTGCAICTLEADDLAAAEFALQCKRLWSLFDHGRLRSVLLDAECRKALLLWCP